MNMLVLCFRRRGFRRLENARAIIPRRATHRRKTHIAPILRRYTDVSIQSIGTIITPRKSKANSLHSVCYIF